MSLLPPGHSVDDDPRVKIPFDPFLRPGPRWFSIPAHRPFLDDLAAGVLAWLGEASPETLSDAIILLPNRRAARAFASALAGQAGDRPVLLPQVRPLGDLEEDEPPFSPGALGLDLAPAIAPLARRFELARMIVETFDTDLSPLRALELADALGGFLDSCAIEEVTDFERISGLVEADLAQHWQESARFLKLAVEEWPRRLSDMGLVDPAWRRARLLRLLAQQWREHPPQGPVIAAGSTGTAPAAADVLAAVASAPRGCVVLPGLDLDLDPSAWSLVAGDEQHPQSALKRLLDRHGIPRETVTGWFRAPVDPTTEYFGLARQRLLNEALRPADATADWRDRIVALRSERRPAGNPDPVAAGLEGLTVASLRTEEEAAAAIALMMRETLEVPGQTCALVTPDLDLSRRVAARLERWGITADDSSGAPLSRLPAGVLLDLCARWTVDPLQPRTLLGLIKHPLVTLAENTPRAATTLERYALRGSRPRTWLDIEARLEAAGQPRSGGPSPSPARLDRLEHARQLAAALRDLSVAVATLYEPGQTASLDMAASGLVRLAEALCGQTLWAGTDGEAAASLMTGMIAAGPSFGQVSRQDLADLIHGVLESETVRTGGASQPRLRILGAMEGRLVRADRMILAGLEEGVWPQAAPTDPFLSRPMRKALGLPPPERRPGQSAQDFVQAACARQAVLVHVERRGGQPSVRSRWLWRLEMLVSGAHDPEKSPVTLDAPLDLIQIARALDDPPPGPARYERRPAPTPPVDRRPRSLPVTSVERWVRDPYAVYADRILGLKKMDRPDADAEALARGNAIHRAIERIVLTWPEALPADCASQIEAFLLEALVEAGFEDHAMARERPLARNCAQWLASWERERRASGATLLIEQSGQTSFEAPGGPFTLTARADRIELLANGAAVIDFKTGQPPSTKQVAQGYAPQLTLTAAILADGGFSGVPPTEATELLYVKLTGRRAGGAVSEASKTSKSQPLDAGALAAEQYENFKAWVAHFDDEATPYASWLAPQFMGTFGGNYDHLARVWEWYVVGGEDEVPE